MINPEEVPSNSSFKKKNHQKYLCLFDVTRKARMALIDQDQFMFETPKCKNIFGEQMSGEKTIFPSNMVSHLVELSSLKVVKNAEFGAKVERTERDLVFDSIRHHMQVTD